MDFKTRKIIMDKKGYYRMIERSILQEEIIILNMYAPNNKPSANKSENEWAKTDSTERSKRYVHYYNRRSQYCFSVSNWWIKQIENQYEYSGGR